MTFAENLKKETSYTRTENGAKALDTTTSGLLDLFSVIGALRNADASRMLRLFHGAVAEDALLTMKTLFYGRDIREGVGERTTFRVMLAEAAKHDANIVIPNIPFIGLYGRYDDLYCLIDTPAEKAMWEYMTAQFKKDLENMKAKKPVSLLAKWIKTPDASSPNTKALGITTSKKLGYKNVGAFKKDLRALRRYLDIVEIQISANNFDAIAYDKLPSKAMLRYRNLFNKKDGERFTEFLDKVDRGEAKINAGTLTPADLVQKVLNSKADRTVDTLWANLPNYLEGVDTSNILVVADVSGSMERNSRLPLATSIGLALYFAERNVGDFANMFMTFSESPKLVSVVGDTLTQKINFMKRASWGMNTNLERMFDVVLETALKNKTPQEELPKSLVIISDMEFDECTYENGTFYEDMKDRYAANGYTIPNVVFWNVNSIHDTYHVDKDMPFVQCFSGASASTFKNVIEAMSMTPYEAMLKTLNSERYSPITIR